MSEASRRRISLDVPWWRAKRSNAGSTISNSSTGNGNGNGNTTITRISGPSSPRFVNVRATDFIDAHVATRLGAQTIEPRPAVSKPRPPSIEFPNGKGPFSPGKNKAPFSPTQAAASPSKPPTYAVDDKERLEKLNVALEKAGLKDSPDDENATLENVGLRRLSSNARDDIDTSISSWSERASSQKPPVNDILWPRPERPNLIIKSSAIPPIAARCFYPSPPPLPTPPMSERSSFTSEGALRSSITETDSDGHISESDNESTTSSVTENILRQSWSKGEHTQNPANSSMTSTVLSGSSSDDDRNKKTKKQFTRGSSTASGNTSTNVHRNQVDIEDYSCDGGAPSETEESVQVDSEYGGDIVDSEEEISREDPRSLKAGFVIDGDETETESDSEAEEEARKEDEEEEEAEHEEADEKVEAESNSNSNSNSGSLPFINVSEDGENEPFVNASEGSSSYKSSSSGGTVAMNDEMKELLKRTEEQVNLDIASKKKAAFDAVKNEMEAEMEEEEEEEKYGEDGFSEPDGDDLWSDSDSEPSSADERQMIRNATPLPKSAKKPSKLVARFFDPDNEAETSRVPESRRNGAKKGQRRRFSAYASSSKRISKGALAARLKSRAAGQDRTEAARSSSRKSPYPTRKKPVQNVHEQSSPSMDLSTVSVASSDEEFDPNMD